MKTTLELPGDLVREVKLRAVNEGRKLKDTVADCCAEVSRHAKKRVRPKARG